MAGPQSPAAWNLKTALVSPFFPGERTPPGFLLWPRSLQVEGLGRPTSRGTGRPEAQVGPAFRSPRVLEQGRAATSTPRGRSTAATGRGAPGGTHRDALPHDAALLHPPGAPELLHVLAEVALSALRPQAGLALAASRPAPASSRRGPVGGQLHRGGGAQLPLGPTYGPVLWEHTQDW